MNVKWQKLIFQVGIWLALEVLFSYEGVDTIADYSEYIFNRTIITAIY